MLTFIHLEAWGYLYARKSSIVQKFPGHHCLRLVNSATVEYHYVCQTQKSHSDSTVPRLETLPNFLGWAYHVQTQTYGSGLSWLRWDQICCLKVGVFKASGGIWDSLWSSIYLFLLTLVAGIQEITLTYLSLCPSLCSFLSLRKNIREINICLFW